MDINVLKKLNLSEKEVKIYLALLEHGATSVRKLAELTKLNRGTVYDALKGLQNIGLVSFYHADTKQRFVAESPEQLVKVISHRENDLKEIKNALKELVPELKSLQDKKGDKPVTKFYESKAGIRFILGDVLESMRKKDDKEYFVYSAASVRDDVYQAYPDFNKKRIKNKIEVKTISLSKGGKTYGLDERKWLETVQESPTYILIYAGKCAFISRDSANNPVGIIIENKMIYETERMIFMKLWEAIK